MAKRVAVLFLALLTLLGGIEAGHAALTPQDQFLKIYFLLQDAERMERNGQYASARGRYTEVADQLTDLKKNYPDWEPSIVNFRIKYARDKIAQLADKSDPPSSTAPAPSAPTASNAAPMPVPAPAPTPAPAPDAAPSAPSVSSETIALKQRISTLEGELADTKRQLNDALTQAADLRQRLDAANRELSNIKSANLEERMATILEENKSLKSKLADAEDRVKTLQNGGDSTTSIPLLKDQLKKVQDQLTYLQAENQAFRTTTNDLKQQLETAQQKLSLADQQSSQLPGGDATRKENEILRGIVTRQLQEQARRDAAKRLADEEISSLHVKSEVLRQQLDILSSPIIALNPEERALLRINPSDVVPSPAPVPSPTPVGTKLLCKSIPARRGLLLLSPENTLYLGGSIPATPHA